MQVSNKAPAFGEQVAMCIFTIIFWKLFLYPLVKILEKRHIVKENKAQYVRRERDLMSILEHPFFVKLYFTFQDDEKLCILQLQKGSLFWKYQRLITFFPRKNFLNYLYLDFGLSYAKNGELLKYIRKIGSFDETCTRFYSAEIVCALEYLHNKGIIHR